MKKRRLVLFAFVLVVCFFGFAAYTRFCYRCDVAVMGPIQFADGIGRQSVGLIDALRNTFSMQYYKYGSCKFKDIPWSVQRIASRKYRKAARILIFEPSLLGCEDDQFPSLPEADIRIAYSMFESTKIPASWVMILNTLFDAVVVPDHFLVDVYKNSGVRIPIFTVPLGMYLDSFLKKASFHTRPKDQPFVFGNLSSICNRKNQLTLVQAFAREFGNNPNLRLVINGRWAEQEYLSQLQNTICSLGLKNVSITNISLGQKDYIRVLKSIDCYVSPSTGEGFSLQPREALAIGLPCIVTDNTGQSTICLSNYVRSVPSLIPIQAKYLGWSEFLGMQFNTSVDDLALALRDVYENYDSYAQKAIEAKTWVKQYEYENLLSTYKTLIDPEKVILSDRDEIKDGILYTTSPKLKQRYEKIQEKQTIARSFFNSLIILLLQM
ncbi:MAG: hypothetical protein JWO53_1366 [Chlamydiia bacterium]|nr:hypothetical protein [Chlamydiia bacterium]